MLAEHVLRAAPRPSALLPPALNAPSSSPAPSRAFLPSLAPGLGQPKAPLLTLAQGEPGHRTAAARPVQFLPPSTEVRRAGRSHVEPSAPPQPPLQKKQAPCCCSKRPCLIALFQFQAAGGDFTFFVLFFKHQFLGMRSPDATGWEVKHRSCQEGSVGRHPCGSQLCSLQIPAHRRRFPSSSASPLGAKLSSTASFGLHRGADAQELPHSCGRLGHSTFVPTSKGRGFL